MYVYVILNVQCTPPKSMQYVSECHHPCVYWFLECNSYATPHSCRGICSTRAFDWAHRIIIPCVSVCGWEVKHV